MQIATAFLLIYDFNQYKIIDASKEKELRDFITKVTEYKNRYEKLSATNDDYLQEHQSKIKEEIKEDLLKYCELDTYAMVKIWEKFKEVIEEELKDVEFSVNIEADIELAPSQINENLVKQLNAINRISGEGFPPVKVLIRTDDYEVSTFSTKKHLKIIDNETGVIIVKWNCMDWQTLGNDGEIVAVGVLANPIYGRKKFLQLTIDEYTQQND